MPNNTPQAPVFEGSWNPSTGAFPIVPSNISSAYYLVTGPGKVGGFDFGEGDWLLYLEEEGSAPNTGSWYRTSGGIIQLATTTQPISLTAADISDFAAAANAAVIIDGTTIVKDPQSGALHVIVGPASGVTNIIEEEDETYVPPHDHVSTDITDFVSAVRAALGPTAANIPFFSNTLVSNAVVFTFNTTLNAVTADVKIDNSTIVKNKYGQLVAGKPQPMSITDILGLSDYLNNYVTTQLLTPLSALGASSPTLGAWQPAGKHNFSGTQIGDAFYLLNVDIVSLQNAITGLTASVDALGLTVMMPPALGSSIIPVLDPSVIFYEAYQSGTANVIGVTFDTTPSTLPTAPFFKGLNAAPSGTLVALIDGANAGQITLDPPTNQTGQKAGALVITQDQDSYLEFPAFRNLFKSIQVQIAPDVPLRAGVHGYQLQETLAGSVPTKSGALTVNVDIPATVMAIANYSLAAVPQHYISGVPTLDPTLLYTLNLTADGVVGFTYGKYVANIVGHDTLIDHSGDVPASPIPPAPSPPNTYSSASIAPFTFHILDEYNEQTALALTPYNSHGDPGPTVIYNMGRIDTTIEDNRVYSGDPTQLYPIDAGGVWDPSKSLVGTTYFGELQKLNQNYQWPVGHYPLNGGPDYTGATGVVVLGAPVSSPSSSNAWRWVTLQLGTNVQGFVAFTLTFTGGNTAAWTCNPYTLRTNNILIYAKLGTSGWVDCNSPYRGIGTADINGAFAMDASGHGYETTASIKRVTLGPSIANSAPAGKLLVRVAIPAGSGMQFSDVVASDWA